AHAGEPAAHGAELESGRDHHIGDGMVAPDRIGIVHRVPEGGRPSGRPPRCSYASGLAPFSALAENDRPGVQPCSPMDATTLSRPSPSGTSTAPRPLPGL